MMASASNCIFCKIIALEIPSPRIFEDDEFIVIRDIQPLARVHLLVIPKQHCISLSDACPPTESPAECNGSRRLLPGRLLEIATQVAREQGLLPDGFRLVINSGPFSGQTVFHLHAHVLGGEPLRAAFA